MTLRDTSTISEAPSETPVQMLDILTRLDFSDGCVLSRSVSDKWKIDNDSLASPAGIRRFLCSSVFSYAFVSSIVPTNVNYEWSLKGISEWFVKWNS